MWFLWIALSNIGVFALEYVYRSGRWESFWAAFPYIVVPVLVVQFGIFYGFKQAPSLILAGAAFGMLGILLRIFNAFLLGEQFTFGLQLAVFFSVVAVLAGKYVP